jgi:hypothetical protein
LSGLTNAGLNGPVTSLVLDGDNLYVGGSFTDTTFASMQGRLRGVAMYDVQQNQWAALRLASMELWQSWLQRWEVQVAGNFTTLLSSAGSSSGFEVAGFATWDTSSGAWVNSGGFLVGSMSFVANSTSRAKGKLNLNLLLEACNRR